MNAEKRQALLFGLGLKNLILGEDRRDYVGGKNFVMSR